MILKFSINYFLFFSTIAVSVPYLQVLLREQGFSSSEIGLLLGFFEVTGIIGPLIAGWAADKIGRYRFLILILSLGSGVTLLRLREAALFCLPGQFLCYSASFIVLSRRCRMRFRPDCLEIRLNSTAVFESGAAWDSL